MSPEMEVTVQTETAPQAEPTVNPQVQPEADPQVSPEVQPQVDPEQTQEVQNIVQEQAKAAEEARTLVNAKGLDYDTLVSEYMDKGSISEDTYKALEGIGLSRSLVDGYIEGVNATNTLFTNQVKQSVGGDKEFDVIASFVSSKGQAAVDAFNNIMEMGDLGAITDYLGGVKAQMQLVKGTANPSLLGGNAQVATGYATMHDLTKDMNDPRYRSSESFRNSVEAKIQKSNLVVFK